MNFSDAPSGWQITGIIATGLVFLGGIYTALEDSTPAVLEEAREAIEKARDAERFYRDRLIDLDVVEEDSRRASALYLAMYLMRGALERIDTNAPAAEQDVPSALIRAAQQHLPIALDFQIHHQWTVAVYRAEAQPDGKKLLVLCDHLRAIQCDTKDARKWPEGTGFMGVAFTNRKEIIVDDARHATTRSFFALAGDQRRSYDDDRYVSFAAVPILVGANDEPWGVAIATNDQAGHFSLDEEPGVRTSEAVRALGGMVELGVSICRRQNLAMKPAETPEK
jgi:hypothetical protein